MSLEFGVLSFEFEVWEKNISFVFYKIESVLICRRHLRLVEKYHYESQKSCRDDRS